MLLAPCWLGLSVNSISCGLGLIHVELVLGGCGCKIAWCCYVNTCMKCSFNQRLILKQV